MLKITPDPPESNNLSAHINATSRKPSTIYFVGPDTDNETLLVNACETLASASVMLNDFAGQLNGTQRHTLLGIQHSVMLGELAVNRMLDNVDPHS